MTVRPPLSAQRRDLREARTVLARWLSNRLPEASNVQLSEIRLPGGAGVANETLLFDATWTEGGADRTGGFVARIESSSFLFMEANFDLHPKIMGQVAAAGIPVPAVVGFEPDQSILGARFFVMEHVPGQVPADQPPYCESGWLAGATTEQRGRLWRSGVTTLARLHDLDANRFEFLWQPQRGSTGLEQYLRYNLESFEWAAHGRGHPVLEAAAIWLQEHLPEDRPTAFAWGDARIGNMIFRDWDCVAVLDWDMASLAGAETDLAWWILFDHAASVGYGLSALPGLGTAQETVSLWEDITGRRAVNIDYHLVFAAFRMALALMRVAQLLRASGVMAEDAADQMEMNNQGVQYLASMLELPAPGPVTVTWPGLHCQ